MRVFNTNSQEVIEPRQATHDDLNVNANIQQNDTDVATGNAMFVQPGTGATFPISAASLPLPSGAATSALQLADGHNVTVDNGAGGSAVNIQDGGNSITVDNDGLTELAGAITAGVMSVEDTSTILDDSIFNITTQRITMMGAFVDDTATDSVGEGDGGAFRMSADRVLYTQGHVAHDAVDSGNPHKIGGRSQEPTSALEEVADDDRTDGAFDRQGRLAVWMGYPVQSADINDSTSGNNTIQAAAGAGLRIAVMGYHVISDGTVDYRWEDGAGGTAFTGQIPLQAREGVVAGYGMHPMWVGTANTLLNLELSAGVNVHGQVSFVVMTD